MYLGWFKCLTCNSPLIYFPEKFLGATDMLTLLTCTSKENNMQFTNYKKEVALNLPPNLDAGTILHKVERIEENTFQLNGKDTKGMRVFADGKEYRTSSGVLMEQFKKFFELHPKEALENVKVVAPRGKKYLTLEEA